MTTDFTAEAEKLTAVCRGIFKDESKWIAADGYPHSLALCIIDSIFSTGSHYNSVINVVNEYRAYRRAENGDADQDGTKELLATFAAVATVRLSGQTKSWITASRRIPRKTPL